VVPEPSIQALVGLVLMCVVSRFGWRYVVSAHNLRVLRVNDVSDVSPQIGTLNSGAGFPAYAASLTSFTRNTRRLCAGNNVAPTKSRDTHMRTRPTNAWMEGSGTTTAWRLRPMHISENKPAEVMKDIPELYPAFRPTAQTKCSNHSC